MTPRPRYGSEFEDEDDDRESDLDDVDLDDVDDELIDDDDEMDDAPRRQGRPPVVARDGGGEWEEFDDGASGDDDTGDGDDRTEKLRNLLSGSRGSSSRGKRSGESFSYLCIPQGIDGKEMPKSEWQDIWGDANMSRSDIRRELRRLSDHTCKWVVVTREIVLRGGKRKHRDVGTRIISTMGPEIIEDPNVDPHPFEDEFDDDAEFDEEDLDIDDIVSPPEHPARSGGGGVDATVLARVLDRQNRANQQMMREMMARVQTERPKTDWSERIEMIATIGTSLIIPLLEMFKPQPRESNTAELAKLVELGVNISRGAGAPDWKQMLGIAALGMSGALVNPAAGVAGGGLPPAGQPAGLPNHPPPLPQGAPAPAGLPAPQETPPAAAPAAQPPAAQPAAQRPAAAPRGDDQSVPPHLRPIPPAELLNAAKDSADYRRVVLWRAMHEEALANNSRTMTADYWAVNMNAKMDPEALIAFVIAFEENPVAVAHEGIEAAPGVVNYLVDLLPPEAREKEDVARQAVAQGFLGFIGSIVDTLNERYLRPEESNAGAGEGQDAPAA